MKALNVRLSPSDYENMAWWFLDSVLMYLSVESEYLSKVADPENVE